MGDFNWQQLIGSVGAWTSSINQMITGMGTATVRQHTGIAITMMLSLEVKMNTLSQFTLGLTNVMQAKNSAMQSIAAGIK